MDTQSVVFWVVLIAIGIAYEMWAVRNKRHGDTLSEMVWWLVRLASPVLWIVAAFLTWLAGHLAGCPLIDAGAFRVVFC